MTRGAAVVYQTLNPPYARWPEEFPGLQAGVLAAAEAARARLVSMENVYMYGRPAGQPLTEDRRVRGAHQEGAGCAAGWPGICWRPIRPAGSRSPSAGRRTTSARAAAPSPTWATGCSRRR